MSRPCTFPPFARRSRRSLRRCGNGFTGAGLRTALRVLCVCLTASLAAGQTPSPAAAQTAPQATPETAPQTADAPKAEPAPQPARPQLNLLGQTDTQSGESRRNENVQFNLIDSNTIRELNTRLGATATLVESFQADRSYFGAEYGKRPGAPLHLPFTPQSDTHGELFAIHNNSVFSARSFFQAGSVKPARENEYGFRFGTVLSGWRASLEGTQQKIRGSVNGNVLVPLPEERTPLATDPATRAIVERFLNAYPRETPNRTDIDQRALNTNAPQRVDTNSVGMRLDRDLGARDRLLWRYQFTSQQVDAFQLVAGQNPDTDTHSHTGAMTWTRTVSASTVADFSLGFERVTTNIRPEPNAVGPTVNASNFIFGLGPSPPTPIVRAQNRFRYAAQFRRVSGGHSWTAGVEINRAQVNGREQDGERGILTFANDFGRNAIANLRFGTANNFVFAFGNTHRGWRNFTPVLHLGDSWQASSRLTLSYGLRYEPFTRPTEVNGIDQLPFGCDCNNLAPRAGFAYRLPGRRGVFRGAYGVQYGELFATTYGQSRMSPPDSYRVVVQQPDLADALFGPRRLPADPNFRTGYFLVSPDMTTPYAHQYNFSWENALRGGWKLQAGYVGSRALKLFQMWFDNRARPAAGVPQTTATINNRRPDSTKLEIFRLVNASRAYFDAARATLIAPRSRGFNVDLSYWFSKSIDLGNDYTSTLSGVDARQGRSQSEAGVHADLKGRSNFDQPHAFLARGAYDTPRFGRLVGSWTLGAVVLLKSGTPFSVESGSDAPGFGNVDGQGGDRVNLVDTALLGRTIGNPGDSARLLPRAGFAFIGPTDARGSLGRNTFRKGGIANWNASLYRAWKPAAGVTITLRAESVNLFNTPQFAEPSRELSSPSFAKITNTLNDGRVFRFSLRARF